MAQNVSQLTSTPWFKARATNATTDTRLVQELSETIPPDLLPTRAPDGTRFRGMALVPFGTDADGETFTIAVQSVTSIGDWGRDGSARHDYVLGLDKQYLINLFSVLTCTLGADKGTAGAYVTNNDFVCDSISVAANAWGTGSLTAYGANQTVTAPSNNIMQQYWLSDFGEADFLRLGFSVAAGTAATANSLVKFYV